MKEYHRQSYKFCHYINPSESSEPSTPKNEQKITNSVESINNNKSTRIVSNWMKNSNHILIYVCENEKSPHLEIIKQQNPSSIHYSLRSLVKNGLVSHLITADINVSLEIHL
jgi:hypothetical protein